MKALAKIARAFQRGAGRPFRIALAVGAAALAVDIDITDAAHLESVPLSSRPYIRLNHERTLELEATDAMAIGMPGDVDVAGFGRCTQTAVAVHGQPVPGGGTLVPASFVNAAMINDRGQVAFVAGVAGSLRNQGVFVADSFGLHPIAMGCGAGGGSGDPGSSCGDPAPTGGTFSGFFQGTAFCPPINNRGDVLFLCDVSGGSSPRGLFLYVAETGTIIKIAAVGDVLPGGGTVGGLTPGSLNNNGTVVFGIQPSGSANVNFYLWESGVYTPYASVGDPAPGGGVLSGFVLGGVGPMPDGTIIWQSGIPAINDDGQIAFHASVSGGPASNGIILSQGGSHAWAVRAGDPTPIGGTFTGFYGPTINASGELAFLGYVETPSTTGGWFVGTPGHWRKALAFGDALGGGVCWGLAASYAPMTPLDAAANLILWTVVRLSSGVEREHLVIVTPSGRLVIACAEGDPTPLGGVYRFVNGWPSLNNEGIGTLDASIVGAPGIESAHLLATGCIPRRGVAFGRPQTLGSPEIGTAPFRNFRVSLPDGSNDVLIDFDLSEPLATLGLRLYDTRGRAFYREEYGPLAQGAHRVSLGVSSGGNVAPGIYFARIEGAGASEIVKFVLVK